MPVLSLKIKSKLGSILWLHLVIFIPSINLWTLGFEANWQKQQLQIYGLELVHVKNMTAELGLTACFGFEFG